MKRRREFSTQVVVGGGAVPPEAMCLHRQCLLSNTFMS